MEYYVLLRSVLKAKPHLRRCLTRCRHCRIFFLTDPRNARRRNLGCPFGCRESHRKQESTRRSIEYYRGLDGRKYKRLQNGNRQKQAAPEPASEPAREPERERDPPPGRDDQAVKPAGDFGSWHPPMVEYARRVISLIEGRRVSLGEVLAMLAKVLRQHSMARRRRIDHVIDWLHENPP